jgi:hypothetical protein
MSGRAPASLNDASSTSRGSKRTNSGFNYAIEKANFDVRVMEVEAKVRTQLLMH